MSEKNTSDSYEVGYGKPPRSTQFRKGVSGNPKGRPKKQAPPSHLNKPILVPLLAYRLQEQAFGGLKPAYKRRLRQLGESFERNPSGLTKTISSSARIKPGTRLIRQWDGQTHQVTVAEEGFEYKGERYRSLASRSSKIQSKFTFQKREPAHGS